MIAECVYCGRQKKIHRNNFPVGRSYHCRECHGRYLSELNSRSGRKPDFSTYRKLKQLAEVRKDVIGSR